MLRLRSYIYAVAFYLTTAVMLAVCLPLLFGPRRWAMAALAAHGRVLVWWLKVICGTKLIVRGHDKLPDGACLVAAKHQAAWDTFALIPMLRDPAIVMKNELMSIPVYGWFSRKFGMIPIRRELGPNALRVMAREAKKRAAAGREILIFPEGTRRTPGSPPRYLPGILMLYDELKVPCVPLALNSGLYWPRHTQTRYPGHIIVEFLDPIPPGLPREEFANLLRERIEEASARLLEEALSGPEAPPDPRPSMRASRKPQRGVRRKMDA